MNELIPEVLFFQLTDAKNRNADILHSSAVRPVVYRNRKCYGQYLMLTFPVDLK
jgi:hypothetical protein